MHNIPKYIKVMGETYGFSGIVGSIVIYESRLKVGEKLFGDIKIYITYDNLKEYINAMDR